jgi:ABC-type transport system involved in multi-copper enzyme maturation permease subunit
MIPVLKREFFGILRSPRALWALLITAVVFAIVVLARWPAGGLVDLSGAGSRGAFLVFAFALLGGVLLLVPAFPATSIVRERNQGTLLLLFNSPIHPLGIYAGKFLGVLAFAGLMFFTTLPAAAAVYAMGGVDPWRQIGLLYAVLVAVAILATAIGLLVSTRATSPDAAVRITYGLIFAVAFLTLAPHALTKGTDSLLATISQLLRRLSPLPVVMHLVGQGGSVGAGLLEKDSGVWQFLVASLSLAAILAVATVLQLDHRLFDRSRDAGKITDDRSLAVRVLRRLFYLVDPQRRTSGIPAFLNPVMVKEFRTRRFGRLSWLLRLSAICAVGSLLMTLAATNGTIDWGVETIGGLLVILQIALVVLLTPSLAAGLIASERERGGWTLLRATTLSGWRIATGKLASVAWTMLLVLAATLPGYLMMTTIKPTMWNQVLLALVSVLFAVAMTLTLSAAIGAFHARTASATVTVYCFLLLLYLGPLVVWAFRGDPFGESFVRRALLITPLGAALAVIEMPGFKQYVLVPDAWWIAGTICVAGLVVYAVQVWRLLRPE